MYQDINQNNPYGYPTEPERNVPPYGVPQPPVNYNAPYQSIFDDIDKKKKKDKKGLSAGKMVLIAVCCCLVGGLLGFVGGILGSRLTRDNTDGGFKADRPGSTTILEGDREDTTVNINQIDTSKEMTAAEVYAMNVNSTVGITTAINTNFWGYQTTSAASGSGFILSEEGYIVTNHHVIDESSSITVSLYNGDSYEAELIGYDEANDIAVLKIDAEGLVPVVLGDSDNLNVGDDVVAIGNPLGELTFTLTAGKISAKDRQITMSTGATMNLMQTDCAINSGNSGGALFNMYGEVVGITNAKYSSGSGEASIDNIGFAIPIDLVRDMITSIIENGYAAKPYIGVSVTDVASEDLEEGVPAGALVAEVVEDGPAEEAGLKADDIITKVNGKKITNRKDLVSVVSKSKIGDELEMEVYRNGKTIDITVTVDELIQPDLEDPEEEESSGGIGDLFPWGSLIPGF